MATKADEKPTTFATPSAEHYAEPEDIQRPPYFGEREEPARPEGPVAHLLAEHLQGKANLCVNAERHYDLNLDGPPPPSAQKWLEDEVVKLKAAPDCPQQLAAAADRLEPKMAEDFLRRRVAASWTVGSIRNALRDWGLWPRARPPKS
jgi:hypothetical protein